MRIFALLAALLLFSQPPVFAQCDFVGSLGILDAPGTAIAADSECTDASGWTHYYHAGTNLLILSVKKNSQDIGSLGNGLNVSSALRNDYGTFGLNLSNADYIDNDIWLVANRSWAMTGANPVADPVQVRFYFSQTDLDDVVALKDNLGIGFPLDLDKLNIYTISNGNGLSAYAAVTQNAGALFTFYDMAPGASPDWASGALNGHFFGEFEITTTDIAGSVGFLFFSNNAPVSISGNVARPNADPVPGAFVAVPGGNSSVTDQSGNYAVPNLNTNLNYTLVPTKNTGHLEGVTATDLIRLSRHLAGMEALNSPYQFIAADADNNAVVSNTDMLEILGLLLGNTPVFPNNSSWRFVPQAYVFPNPNNPFSPPFPESLSYTPLQDSMSGQHFTGIKIGDIGEASPNPPPALNTAFLLPEVGACLPGEELVFDLTTQDFQGLRGFQFTLEWDPAVMSFMAVENLNLPGLTAQSIGTASAADGLLSMVWFNPAQMGTSIADGAAICSLRFVASGNVNDTTPLRFTNALTDALVVHQNLAEQVPLFTDGATVIGNNSTIGANAAVQPTDCAGSAIGSIDLTVSGVVPPVSYAWSNGATTEDIIMLSAGVYTVTITDASGGCPKVVVYEIALGGQFDILADVMHMTCPTVLNGRISLQVNGGMHPFTYKWNNGKTTPTISNLYQGDYFVTVTDAANCSKTASYTVENNNRIFPQVTVQNSNNPGTSNGAVMVNNILGGLPPFTFLWNNGATTQSIMDVPPGHYAVTITDQIGCGHVFGYLVHDLMVTVSETHGGRVVMALYPNPMERGAHFTLAIESSLMGNLQTAVFAANGQLVGRQEMNLSEGTNQFELPVPGQAGLYFLQVMLEGERVGWLKMVVW